MQPVTQDIFEEVVRQYGFTTDHIEMTPFGNGHINDTFLLPQDGIDYIIQRININVFTRPLEVMHNIAHVTDFLAKKIRANGEDPRRKTLTLISCQNGKKHYQDREGNYWRVTPFIPNTVSYQMVETPEMFRESARAFGEFQRLLDDYPAETLHETIPKFHDTRDRFNNFAKAVEEDRMNRAKDVQKEINFVLEREQFTATLVDLLDEGKLPLRVTHNDTKLNNVLIDKESGKAVCVIDLDTVMPGLSLYDYGDSIRFGASTAEEDEKDLNKVWMNLDLFDAYTDGFLEKAGDALTPLEIEHMPTGAKMMTLECGMRFLADHLNGDSYFRIHYPGQNLDRARTQFKLVADMEKKWDDMQKIVAKYAK